MGAVMRDFRRRQRFAAGVNLITVYALRDMAELGQPMPVSGPHDSQRRPSCLHRGQTWGLASAEYGDRGCRGCQR